MINSIPVESIKVVKPFKRFLSFLADFFVLFILASGLYSVAIYPLVGLLPTYKEAMQKQIDNQEICQNLYIDSHLVTYREDGTIKKGDQIVKDYILSRLEDDNNDIFIYFYQDFYQTLHFDGQSSIYDLDWIYDNIFLPSNEESPLLWERNDDSLPILNNDAKSAIGAYLDNDITQINEKYYLKLKSFTEDNLLKCESLLLKSDEYKIPFSISNNQDEILYLHISISSSLTFIVFFFLYYLLVPSLMKNGQTFAKKIMHIGLYQEDGQQISFKSLFLRSILEFVSYYFMVLFIPFFEIGWHIFKLPMITFMGLDIKMFIFALVSFLVALISFIYMCASKKKQTLYDHATYVVAVDLNAPIEETELKEDNKEEK